MTDDGHSRSADEGSGSVADESPSDGKVVQASFLQFLSGMAAQALMHLGVMTNPMTGKMESDLANAKYSIDLLSVIEEKTRGNLDEEEEAYLTSALYELRLRYVQATKTHDEESHEDALEGESDATREKRCDDASS